MSHDGARTLVGGKIETNIPGFDLITGGGILKSSAVLFAGDADGRKEILARQICWNILQRGGRVLYYTVDRSAQDLEYDMNSYGWEIKPFEDSGHFRIVDIFSSAAEDVYNFVKQDKEEENAEDNPFRERIYDLSLLYKEGIKFFSPLTILQDKPRIAVLDSLSPLLSTQTEEVLKFIHGLRFATRVSKATGIAILHKGVHEKRLEETVRSLADGILELTRSNEHLSDSSV
ncbi:hypothetical protein MUP77_24300, partial [Candidatus Bathyarchaeota archaeon]|nr:hypothetical protein [Candidatus Bathyarchaeota archaeon]